MPAKRALIMHPYDNVATALEEIRAGDEVAIPVVGTALMLRVLEAIPFGFKIALQEIPKGGIIRKPPPRAMAPARTQSRRQTRRGPGRGAAGPAEIPAGASRRTPSRRRPGRK